MTNFEKVKNYYEKGLWTKIQVEKATENGLNMSNTKI